MSKNFQTLLHAFFALIVVVIGNYVIVAQQTVSGTWKSSQSDWQKNLPNQSKEDKQETEKKVHLNFKYDKDGNDRDDYSFGSSFKYSDLRGLTESQVSGSNSPVKFSIVREAGTIECEGTFQNGKGTGTFRFTPNQQFVSAMKSRGFDFEKPNESDKYNRRNTLEHRLLSAALLDITTALADDLRSANFGNLDTDDLFKAKIFKVDSAYMKEMKASGFQNLSFDDLVKGRIFKIDGEYLRELNTAGFGRESFENVVRMKIFKITPEFINGYRQAGFNNLTMDELQKLSIFKVTPEFIKELCNEGLKDLSVEQLTKMKIFNINGEVIRKAKADKVELNPESLVQYKLGFGRRAEAWY